MDGMLQDAKAARELMLRNSEYDLLVALDDVVEELWALQRRTTELRAALRTIRAELRALEGIAA